MGKIDHEKLIRKERFQASERELGDKSRHESDIVKPWHNRKPRRKHKRRKSTSPKESIEEFVARGGKIEKVTREES